MTAHGAIVRLYPDTHPDYWPTYNCHCGKSFLSARGLSQHLRRERDASND